MSTVRLIIKTAELKPEGILIKSMEVIDGVSGEHLKIAKLNQELIDFMKCFELDATDYMTVMHMKEKNPNFMKLCQNLRLYK